MTAMTVTASSSVGSNLRTLMVRVVTGWSGIGQTATSTNAAASLAIMRQAPALLSTAASITAARTISIRRPPLLPSLAMSAPRTAVTAPTDSALRIPRRRARLSRSARYRAARPASGLRYAKSSRMAR